MARGARNGGHHASRRPIDLTGTISLAEKNDLVTLVNAITEKMLNDISSIFDSPPITPIQGYHGHHHWLSLSLLTHKGNKENTPPTTYPGKSTQGDGSKSYSKTHHIIEKEEKEAMTPQLQELKKEAVTFYQKWQTLFLNRIRELSVQEQPAQTNGPPFQPRGRGRGARGSVRSRGGRAAGKASRGSLTLATGTPRTPSSHIDHQLSSRFPPIPTSLWKLDPSKRRLLLHIVFLLTLSLQEYTAYSRLLLLNLTSSLNLPLEYFHKEETRLARGLSQSALDVPVEDSGEQKPEENKVTKKWKLGLGHGGFKPSGDIHAALKAVGVGTDQGGLGLPCSTAAALLGAMAEYGQLVGCLFGITSTRPVCKVIEGFGRDIQDFAFLPLHGEVRSEYRDARQTPAEDRRLRLVVGMSGWITDLYDESQPWRCLGSQAEAFAVKWESAALANLGNSLETVVKSAAWRSAKDEILSRTIFTSLMESIWPVPLLKISKIIDNPWNIGMVRAEKAGFVLADALMRHRVQGDRPVSLVGYSLASRAIYACLMVLAERRQFGLVDSVVMMGTPAPSESRVWLTLKSVVSGRLVNVYSEHDYILGFLYRTSNIQFGVAGLQEIQGADGVENHCLRRMESGHLAYQELVGEILEDIGWEDLDTRTSPSKGKT
ncbi:hypothetical protein S7711_09098 [Stachybotrys chartarum IBT 7711]|uniref:DUF726 domain-containing protein n=1 Tax=Stachybotrys chartarum (strain CBS 109288 / IBT 7711) TaxID=1280523 RepID=A0A084AXS1_STACB|nr:hypothetical protein S7711_09098 [Stachybotrys chartarum IBT 7711]KFA50240.1 hypothetical protein S40293_03339 [Stachybotrys chartarum IBT 40293]